jgi:hypothetical protein
MRWTGNAAGDLTMLRRMSELRQVRHLNTCRSCICAQDSLDEKALNEHISSLTVGFHLISSLKIRSRSDDPCDSSPHTQAEQAKWCCDMDPTRASGWYLPVPSAACTHSIHSTHFSYASTYRFSYTASIAAHRLDDGADRRTHTGCLQDCGTASPWVVQ